MAGVGSALSEREMAALRGRLLAERERYRSMLESTALNEPMSESAGELSSFDQHAGDLGNEMFERERKFGQRTDFEVTLDRIDAALGKIASGDYGVCEACRGAIGKDRLEALPFAEHCVDCAADEV